MNWSNMRNLEVGGQIGFESLATLEVTYHYFQLHEAEGRWTNAGGATVGSGFAVGNTDNDLGHELDAVLVFKPWKPLMVQPGYGVFFPVGAAQSIAGDAPQHFLYLWLIANF